MANSENILISLESRHANNIYAGSKQVELRRRALNVNEGDVVWIYEKIPVGSITGCACIVAVHVAAPASLWQKFGRVSGLDRDEFFAYFSDLKTACAIELSDARRIINPIKLSTLRSAAEKFQPPQFFLRLEANQPILDTILDSNRKQTIRKSKQCKLFAPA